MTPIDISFTSMRSLFIYGPDSALVTLEMELPHRFIDPIDETLGGRRVSSAGLGASFVVRRDEIWSVPLRFREEQWPAVLALITWGQTEESFTWYPDADDTLTSYEVFLNTPEAGTRVTPTRNAEFPWMQELTIELRRSLITITGPVGYPEYVPPDDTPPEPEPEPGIPAFLQGALIAVRRASHDSDQPNVCLDQSGNGAHLWLGGTTTRDSVLGYGPFSAGKVGVVHGGVASRSLGYANTAQRLNVGAAGGVVRFEVNFTADLAGTSQAIVSHYASGANRAWWIELTAAGELRALLTEDGSTARGGNSTVALTTVFSDWDDCWIAVEYDFDLDLIRFYTSIDDGENWVQLGGTRAFGASLSGMFQPTAGTPMEFGSVNTAATTPLIGGAVYLVRTFEDGTPAWEVDLSTVAHSDLVEVGANQGAVPAAAPTVETDHYRTNRTSTYLETFYSASAPALSNQFDVAVGESFTIILRSAMDSVQAGAGGFHIPIAKKSNGAAGSQGWGIENDGNVNGFDWRVSNGSNQDPTAVSQIVDDDELATIILEVDPGASEVRMRALGEAAITGVYADQGTGTNAFGVFIGRTGTGGFGMAMNFVGLFITKEILTTDDFTEISAWLAEAP